ncbi:MAG: serine hydrolase, partial [Gemmatimonadota bacterium]|nr:serine hydrolase [Gemmatimonadota bacterium]
MKRNRSRVRALVPATLALLAPGLLPAQEPGAVEPRAETETAARPALSDVAELEAWLDGFMASHLEELPSAGAAVAIVLDGEPLLARGYGLADVEKEVPVDASTLFRIGSVSKLFTWTAVMQLVERGILDLETDINEYMGDVQVPDTYPEPVTLRHLLTHTAGFEDHVVGLFGSDEDDVRPLEEILREEMPARVRPPGEVASYSNHGTGMAAHIVERVTG